MQRILVIMALFALTVPAVAAVSTITVTLTDDGSNNVTLSYTTDANVPRAFALDIETINDVNLVNVQPCNEPNQEKGYWVYPGSIDIIDNDVNGYGTPKGDGLRYPGTKTGNKAMTIEMGSLYVGDGNDPCKSGDLVTFQVVGSVGYCISVSENDIRGGIVMEDPNEEPTVVLVGACGSFGCFPACHEDYQEWLDVGSPPSWCIPRQCHGDADGLEQTLGWFDYWVSPLDLDVFLVGWMVDVDSDPCMAGDFTHSKEQIGWFWYRVGYEDLDLFLDNWMIASSSPDVPEPNCLDCP